MPLRLDCFTPVGPATDLIAEPAGLLLNLGVSGKARLRLFRADVLHFEIVRDGVEPLRISPAVIAGPEPADDPAVEETAVGWQVAWGDFRVEIARDPFSLAVRRTDGSPISVPPEHGSPQDLAPVLFRNDEWVLQRRMGTLDRIFGLGEKGGRSNRKGRVHRMFNCDVLGDEADGVQRLRDAPTSSPRNPAGPGFDPYYVSIPFYLQAVPSGDQVHYCGHFVDNPCPGTFDLDSYHRALIHFEGGAHSEYFLAGPGPAEVVRAYAWLTGKPPLPPLWSLGFHQCRWHDYQDADIRRLAESFRSKEIPCDVLWMDIHHMNGYRVFTWDRTRFPDPERLLSDLSEDGFRCITIVDPGVKVESGLELYEEGLRLDAFCKTEEGRTYRGQVWPGITAFPDFTKAATRTWWGEKNAQWIQSGIAGIWNDMNEPATGVVPPDSMRFDFEGKNLGHRYGHNLYATLMAMATAEGLHKARPDQRTFILSRAGSPGIQRYAANWLGDNQSTWEMLAVSIPMSIGLSLSGQPFVGADVGGFLGRCQPELFARWIAAACLMPFFRCHNVVGEADQYCWSFGTAVEKIARDMVQLRYRLIPYLYSNFVHCCEIGDPVIRPLFHAAPQDPVALDRDGQFLVGDSLLVAPVTEPGLTHQQVYLPEGEWMDWNHGTLHEGPSWVTVSAPLHELPLFVRAGHPVALWPEAPASTHGYAPAGLVLRMAIPSIDAKSTVSIREDDGLTTAASTGAHLATTVTTTHSGTRGKITLSHSGDGYPEFQRSFWQFDWAGPHRPTKMWVDGKTCEPNAKIPFALAGLCLEYEV